MSVAHRTDDPLTAGQIEHPDLVTSGRHPFVVPVSGHVPDWYDDVADYPRIQFQFRGLPEHEPSVCALKADGFGGDDHRLVGFHTPDLTPVPVGTQGVAT